MALSDADWGALAGVLAIILAVVVYNAIKAREPKAMVPVADADASMDGGLEPGESVDPRLCKFAHHAGMVVGETVAIEEGRMIIKQAGVFKAIDASLATLVDDEVLIEGEIDWNAAEAEGSTWLTDNRTGHDEGISDRLTTSDEVRSPALAAFEQRHGGADDEE